MEFCHATLLASNW